MERLRQPELQAVPCPTHLHGRAIRLRQILFLVFVLQHLPVLCW